MFGKLKYLSYIVVYQTINLRDGRKSKHKKYDKQFN